MQDLRKQVGLELDETIDLWLDAPANTLVPLEPYLDRVLEYTLTADLHRGAPPAGVEQTLQEVQSGAVSIGLRGRRDHA